MSKTNEFNPTARFLMGPGPSDVHPRVLKAMATPLIGHLDPQFIQIMDRIKDMLRQLFQTKNDYRTGRVGREDQFSRRLC